MNNKLIVKHGEKCPTCGSYFDRHVSVDGLIIKSGKILLILRNSGQEIGKWALIGGVVDWDETVEEAIIREVREEVGLNVKIEKLLGVYSDPQRCPDNKQMITIAFILSSLGDTLLLEHNEISKAKWFFPDALPEIIAFDHRKIIEDYFKTVNSSS